MFAIEIQIKRAQLTSRIHARIMRDLNRECMERQLQQRVPKHFEMVAYSRYQARARSEKYNEGKRKKFGHIKPNVRTGFLRDSIRGKITATQHGARLMLRAKLKNRKPDADWEKMTPEQKARWLRNNVRRLANWQKREIAVMAKEEIRDERKTQAREYRRRAIEYRQTRTRRVK